jgi:sigma-B regulation protein RsbU (phosphoserine phosphatase)
MIPARDVGGDFYDFFLIDDDRLGFVIGDVSGKGLPAAIFMAVARTLLRATALQGGTAGECLEYLNGILARQREAATYVTIFYCVLHTATGELEYAIAGHSPACLVAPGDRVKVLNEPHGLMCGAFERARFESGRTLLTPRIDCASSHGRY